jgi:polyhydroxyalkanoate synthesis regulator protein
LRTIIKHANRRLYDTLERRTVTLLEVSELVTGGESISVIDKASGEDITAVTLLQSLLERLRKRSAEILEAHEVDRLVAELREAMALRRGAAEPREAGLDAGVGTGAGTAGGAA